jgi:hypothetical protein
VKNANHEDPRYAVFSTLPYLHIPSVQIISTPCSQTPSVYPHALMSETKFHTHTEQGKINIAFHITLILVRKFRRGHYSCARCLSSELPRDGGSCVLRAQFGLAGASIRTHLMRNTQACHSTDLWEKRYTKMFGTYCAAGVNHGRNNKRPTAIRPVLYSQGSCSRLPHHRQIILQLQFTTKHPGALLSRIGVVPISKARKGALL